MKTLIIDTTRKELVVGLVNENKKDIRIENDIKHNETLLPLIDKVLTENKIELSEIDNVAVNVGPGSFTGIRVGVSVVKGFGCALKFNCLPLNTLELVALSGKVKSGLVMLSAGAENYYVAVVKNGKIEEQKHLTIEEYLNGYEAFKVYALQSERECFGKINVAKYIEKLDYDKYIFDKIEKRHFCDASCLQPVYLRLSQAERELLAKEGKC